MATLSESIQAYASKPSDASLAASVVSGAQDVVTSLNDASASVQAIRLRADQQITSTVADLNDLLARFQVANDTVKNATATGGDPNDALDQRETLLKQISEIVGVSASTRDNNDMVLYTSDGTTLFETIPRAVTFAPTNGYDASTTGNSVYIDGVVVPAGQGANTTAKGSLAGLLQLRDEIAPVFQSQLDEIARGLITVFAESDPSGNLADQAGLFIGTDSDIPASATIVTGLAAAIKVNPAASANPSLLRDGGINGTDYVVNSGGSSYSALLQTYVTGLQSDQDFDPAANIDPGTSVMSFATNSVGWLEQLRSSASSADETKTAALSRTTEAYSNSTGVSLDEELSLLLDVEQSYKAAAKLLSTVDEMLQSLLDIAS
jgi:flagellar hook-associated protein 1 FlgK